jgi:hypothetical protein
MLVFAMATYTVDRISLCNAQPAYLFRSKKKPTNASCLNCRS